MVHWWILGAGFPIDTGDHGGCWQWTFEEHRSDCEHVYVIRTSRVLSPDGAWPERWLSGMIEVGTRTFQGFSRHLASRHLNLSSSSPVLLCRTQANPSHFNQFSFFSEKFDQHQRDLTTNWGLKLVKSLLFAVKTFTPPRLQKSKVCYTTHWVWHSGIPTNVTPADTGK